MEGFNANGITATPDGRGLLVVNSTTGLLHRVDPRTGATSVVDLGGASLTNGDGMLLLGRTLYVVRNRLNQIAVIHLDRSGSRGVQVDTLTSDDFDVPTTVAAYRDRLYLPNARFTTTPEPDTPYWVTARSPLNREPGLRARSYAPPDGACPTRACGARSRSRPGA